ncbi:MAG: acyltransferase [Clostridia bacterium]|nr:acyltransferase [Clostridia bacterium]
MIDVIKILHLKGIKHHAVMYLVNKVFSGVSIKHFERKRRLLNSIGYKIGSGTKIVGPIECTGKLVIGTNCWIGKNLRVNGNGTVVIGDNCDIAPEVTFQTGGHEIGGPERRAGKGIIANQTVGNGVWIGGRATIVGNTKIGDSSVIAGCACVVNDVESNVLVGGVPAKIIRRLEDASSQSI